MWTIEGQGKSGSAIAPAVVKRKDSNGTSYTVFLGGRTLKALKFPGGNEVWKAGPPQNGTDSWGAPLVHGDTVIATNGTTLAAYDLDGRQLP